jgi:hypothetical protein
MHLPFPACLLACLQDKLADMADLTIEINEAMGQSSPCICLTVLLLAG